MENGSLLGNVVFVAHSLSCALRERYPVARNPMPYCTGGFFLRAVLFLRVISRGCTGDIGIVDVFSAGRRAFAALDTAQS